jgi:hypothetical protein
MQASTAADADDSAFAAITAFVQRVEPDFDKLRETQLGLQQFECNGAMTPLRYDDA